MTYPAQYAPIFESGKTRYLKYIIGLGFGTGGVPEQKHRRLHHKYSLTLVAQGMSTPPLSG